MNKNEYIEKVLQGISDKSARKQAEPPAITERFSLRRHCLE